MAAKGKFFAVGKPQWQIACGLGLRPAVALIVMACGSGHDNATTTWSRKAIEDHTGMTWRRAHDAQAALIDAGILTVLKGGARPVHKLRHPECGEGLIWLPTELVTGAGDETPPVARLRQAGDLDLLQLLVELYFEQELVGDGGLPRSMVRGEFSGRAFVAMARLRFSDSLPDSLARKRRDRLRATSPRAQSPMRGPA